MVQTYNDPVKQAAREKLSVFIRKKILPFRNPTGINVVCFPGAEIPGEEALEVKKVYDSLGIPRENIVGLEEDPVLAKRLEEANLGICVVNDLDINYFRNTQEKFDIISLDYTGQQTDDRLKALEVIIGRSLLNNYSILCTNYMAKRESKDMQKLLFHKFSRYGLDQNGTLISREKEDGRISELEGILQGGSLDLKSVKNAITYEIIRILKLGKRNIEDLEILRRMPYTEQIIQDVKEQLTSLRKTEQFAREKRILIEAGIFTSDEFDKLHTDPPINTNNIQNNLINGLSCYVAECFAQNEKFEIPSETADSIAFLLASQENKPYFPVNMERYSYNSNKNALMFTDMLFLDQMKKEFDKLNDVVYAETSPFRIKLNPMHKSLRKLFRSLLNIQNAFAKAEAASVPERVYLGSSWKPPKRKEKISKEAAIDLLRAGCSPTEISECYSGFTKMQLAAFKAHYVTMGKSA